MLMVAACAEQREAPSKEVGHGLRAYQSGATESLKGRSERYHYITETNYGFLGKLGALTYILNKQGRPISEGYHEITKIDGGFTAKLGATTTILNEDGTINKELHMED
jgi:hypothetical protein